MVVHCFIIRITASIIAGTVLIPFGNENKYTDKELDKDSDLLSGQVKLLGGCVIDLATVLLEVRSFAFTYE